MYKLLIKSYITLKIAPFPLWRFHPHYNGHLHVEVIVFTVFALTIVASSIFTVVRVVNRSNGAGVWYWCPSQSAHLVIWSVGIYLACGPCSRCTKQLPCIGFVNSAFALDTFSIWREWMTLLWMNDNGNPLGPPSNCPLHFRKPLSYIGSEN